MNIKEIPINNSVNLAFFMVNMPECNALIPTETDPISGEPDYNVCVRLI